MNKATRKRLLGVLVILCVSLSLVSCTAAPAEDSVSVGDNEFRLSSLPELEPFEPFTEISSRYYDEYTERLIPADNYGRLYPYPGQVVHSDWMNETRYGLCDSQGRIVLDPVCTYITIQRFDDVEIMQLSYRPTNVTEEDMSMYESIDNTAYAAVDGSWVVDDCPGYLMYADEEVFVINGIDYDDTYMYTTNYIYNIADGTLRSQLPMSQLVDCQQGMLLLKERKADGSDVYRLADYDGETIRELDCTNAILCGDKIIVGTASGLWGITDMDGNYLVAPQYQSITAAETDSDDVKYFCADTTEGTTQLITADGEIVLDIGASANISSVNDDRYPDLYYVREYGQSLAYFIDVSTGDRGPVLTDTINYIGNGWYSTSNYEDKLTIYKWGQSDPWVEITNDAYLNAWCELLTGTENTVAIQVSSTDDNDNYRNYTMLYDLSAKSEVATIDGVYSSYIDFGEGYTFWNTNSGIYSIYDDAGHLLQNTGFTYLTKIDDDHYTVANNIYGGVIDSDGEWLIRIYLNTLDQLFQGGAMSLRAGRSLK